MDFRDAQRDIAAAYVNGAPGVLVSGIVWLAAGLVEQAEGTSTAFAVLFFGGVLIFPLSMLLCRMVFRSPSTTEGNALERLGFENIVMLFAGILLGFVALKMVPQLAFPAVAVAVGARYFTFRTLYGDVNYWFLGGIIALIGTADMIASNLLPVGTPLLVGMAECFFAAILLIRWRELSPRSSKQSGK